MQKDRISVRQACFILAAYGAVTKLMLYPAAAASAGGNDLLFPILFNLVLQTAVIGAVGYLCSKTDKTFFALIEDSLGRVTARVVYGLLGLYLLFSAIVPMNEQQLLVHDCFYDTMPSLYIFMPFFFFSVYAGAKGFKNAGRCADVCLPIFVAAMLFFMVTSLGQGDYSNLLPVLKRPFKEVAGATLAGAFRFDESALLLLFMGRFKYRKGDAAKLTLSYLIGGLTVIVLAGAYYALYGPLAPSRTFLLNNVSAFFPAIGFVGRVDLVAVYALDIVILFAIVLNVQACVHCLSLAFGWEDRAALSLIVNAALVAVTFILNNNFSLLQQAAARWFWIPALIFAYLMPLAALALRRKR